MANKPEIGIKYFRGTAIERQSEGDNDVFTFSWSSEYPVDMYFYKEILSHDEGCINLERLAGMNLLWNHDRNVVLGKIERVWVENKKAYCEAKWSKKPSIAEYRQDVNDGIVTNASFLYTVEEYEEKRVDEEDYCFLGKRWTPYEISLVSVPADPTVGVGRAVSESIIKENPRVIMEKTVLDVRNEELQRLREISAMGDKFQMPELAKELIENGTELSIARKTFLDKMNTYQKPVAKAINTSLGLSDKEQRQYSLRNAINAVAFQNPEMIKQAQFEMECSQEIAKRLGRATNGFFMPMRDLRVRADLKQRDTYAVGSPTTGGYTVQTDLLEQEFIELLRNQAMVMQLGASFLSGLVGNVDIPGQASAETAYWVGENEAVTQSEGTFKQIPLRMKTVGALSVFTRSMMMQSSIDIEMRIRNSFARTMALAIDKAALSGTGLANQPRGILNTSGIGSISLGANGGSPTWGSVVGLMREIQIENAMLGGTSWLTNPHVLSKLMTTPIQSGGTEGNFILKEPGNILCGYPFYTTNQVPADLTKGSGTDLSALILGNWPELIIGEWGVFEVLANPFADNAFAAGSIKVRCMQSVDINIGNPEAFAVITDMITTL